MRYRILLLVLFLSLRIPAHSQENPAGENRKNSIKINLLSLPLAITSLQYERVFSKHSSLALGLYVIPSRRLPNIIAKQDSSGILEAMKISGYSITPEFRVYFGKKDKHPVPRGFYLAPYFRHTAFTLTSDFSYTDSINVTRRYHITGNYNSWSAGMLAGIQWVIGKRLLFDFWMAGAHYGSATAHGELKGDLTVVDQKDFKKDLESASPPSGSVTSDVSDTGATLNMIGPFGGFRLGLVLGFRF